MIKCEGEGILGFSAENDRKIKNIHLIGCKVNGILKFSGEDGGIDKIYLIRCKGTNVMNILRNIKNVGVIKVKKLEINEIISNV